MKTQVFSLGFLSFSLFLSYETSSVPKSASIPVDINVLQQTEGDVCYKGPKITAEVNLGTAWCRIEENRIVRAGLTDEPFGCISSDKDNRWWSSMACLFVYEERRTEKGSERRRWQDFHFKGSTD